MFFHAGQLVAGRITDAQNTAHHSDVVCDSRSFYSHGKGTNMYVGAVVGRNVSDKGAVHQCYYLKGSATCNGDERNASGTTNGSMYDGDTENNNDCASFTDPLLTLSRDAGCGDGNLINALNTWVEWWNDGNCNAEWVEGFDGYPMPNGEINTNKGTKQ